VSVAPGRGRVRHAPTPTVHEAFSGTAALHPAITLARTVAISALLAMSSTSALSGSRGLASRASVALSLTALATPDVTYAIGVADAVSATAVMTTFQAKGHSSRQRTP
jgi:hypothetical protein